VNIREDAYFHMLLRSHAFLHVWCSIHPKQREVKRRVDGAYTASTYTTTKVPS
jgi:hypothetical protein